MPSIAIHPRAQGAPDASHAASVPGLPQILQTPSGLAVLEIQGTIHSSETTSDTSEAVQPVGKLVFPAYDPSKGDEDTSWHKRVYLYIGKHQRLTGEVKTLAKPLAVLRKLDSATGSGSEALEIAEIVRWKLLFAHRPEPVGGASSAAG